MQEYKNGRKKKKGKTWKDEASPGQYLKIAKKGD